MSNISYEKDFLCCFLLHSSLGGLFFTASLTPVWVVTPPRVKVLLVSSINYFIMFIKNFQNSHSWWLTIAGELIDQSKCTGAYIALGRTHWMENLVVGDAEISTKTDNKDILVNINGPGTMAFFGKDKLAFLYNQHSSRIWFNERSKEGCGKNWQ